MSNHPHQRKLRRSIGSQPVGSVVGPRQPEVGIAGQVIPSQSPRRTFRSSDDRDLANLANLVAGDHGGPTRALISGLYLGLSSAFRKNVEELASRRASTTRQALPSPSNCPNVSSGFMAGEPNRSDGRCSRAICLEHLEIQYLHRKHQSNLPSSISPGEALIEEGKTRLSLGKMVLT